MNYYIESDAAKAEQIKAAFESKGYDTGGWKFNVNGAIYYTTDEKKIDIACSNFLINLIKTHPDYKELELPVEPKFKVGDWLVYKDHGTFCGGLRTVQIQTVERNRYVFTHGTDGSHRFIDDECRLWTTSDIKDGDVLVYQDEIFLVDLVGNNSVLYHCCFDGELVVHSFYAFSNEDLLHVHPATKEQRDLLFAKMKEAGYQWNVDKKELRKIQPHYDIKNFHVGMPVLVRADNVCRWDYSLFSRITGNDGWPFAVCNGVSFTQCIPFNEETKHLLGTTDMCDERFINW